jgi:hypothetical protein
MAKKEPATVLCTYPYLLEVCADLFDTPPAFAEFKLKFYPHWGIMLATHLDRLCTESVVRANAELLCSLGDAIMDNTLVDLEKQGFVMEGA